MMQSATEVSYINRNNQRLIAKADRPGTDCNQYVWELRREDCGTEYSANGSNFYHRKCPVCQGGTGHYSAA